MPPPNPGNTSGNPPGNPTGNPTGTGASSPITITTPTSIGIADIKNILTYHSSNELITNRCMRYYYPIKIIVIGVLLAWSITNSNDFFSNISKIVYLDKHPSNKTQTSTQNQT
jgi:hypothetical protein